MEIRSFVEGLKVATNIGELERVMHPIMLTSQAIDAHAPRCTTRRGRTCDVVAHQIKEIADLYMHDIGDDPTVAPRNDTPKGFSKRIKKEFVEHAPK